MVQADAFPNRLQELTDILVTCGELLAQSFKPLLILRLSAIELSITNFAFVFDR